MTLLVFADISSDELTFSCIISNTWHMQHHRSLQKQTYKQSIFQSILLIRVLCNMWIITISWKPLGWRFSSFEKFTLQPSAPSLSYKQVIIYKSHLKGRPRSSMPILQKRLILLLSKRSIFSGNSKGNIASNIAYKPETHHFKKAAHTEIKEAQN